MQFIFIQTLLQSVLPFHYYSSVHLNECPPLQTSVRKLLLVQVTFLFLVKPRPQAHKQNTHLAVHVFCCLRNQQQGFPGPGVISTSSSMSELWEAADHVVWGRGATFFTPGQNLKSCGKSGTNIAVGGRGRVCETPGNIYLRGGNYSRGFAKSYKVLDGKTLNVGDSDFVFLMELPHNLERLLVASLLFLSTLKKFCI